MSIDLVNNDKQQLNHILVELLRTLDEVCQRYKIKYFVFAGTMLGAIRHKGIIPWDDDVDVVLWREDYNRLMQVADEGAFQPPFFFQNPKTDPGFPKGYCRLRNSNSNVSFDLVIYTTPPITFVSAVNYLKKRDGAKTYLLLKDIFPQNAVDIGLMSKTGLKGMPLWLADLIHRVCKQICAIILTLPSGRKDCLAFIGDPYKRSRYKKKNKAGS